MSYDEMQVALDKGKKMMRPHWHWVYIQKRQGRAMVVRDDGSIWISYKSVASDRAADDWMEFE